MGAAKLISVLIARWRLVGGVLFATVATTVVISLMLPKTYTAATSLVVDFRTNDPMGSLITPASLSVAYMATQIDIVRSRRVALKVVDNLGLDKNDTAIAQFESDVGGSTSIRDWLADLLLDNLKVLPSRDSRIITLEYDAVDAKFASMVANAFAQAYIDTTLELSIDPARRSAAWFDDQLKSLRVGVETAQSKLTAYQRQHGIVATDERLDTETAKLNSLSQELISAQALTVDANSRVMQSQRLLRDGAQESETIPEVINNQFVQSLKTEILRQTAKLDELSRTVGENHPHYLNARAETESLKRKLNSEIGKVARGIENMARLAREREATLQRAANEQKKKLLSLRQQREELNVLVRELETARHVYEAAMQRSNQINLESQFNQTNVNVLTEAVEPIEYSSPKILLNTILSIFLGAVLAVAVGWLFEQLDRRVRRARDVVDELGLPLIGVLVDDSVTRRESISERIERLLKRRPRFQPIESRVGG